MLKKSYDWLFLREGGGSADRYPGNARIVCDAAAKFEGISLNDALLTCPDIITS